MPLYESRDPRGKRARRRRCCVHVHLCAYVRIRVRGVLLRPRGGCVRERRERARARRGGFVWESARVRVYAAVRA